jgi:hypothetical protein
MAKAVKGDPRVDRRVRDAIKKVRFYSSDEHSLMNLGLDVLQQLYDLPGKLLMDRKKIRRFIEIRHQQSSFPKPLLLLGTEDGTASVKRIKGVDFVKIERSEDLDELRPVIREKYKSCVLDTGGGLQDIVMKEVLGLEDMPIEKSWGLAGRNDWGTIGVQTKTRLKELLDLAELDGVNVVIIAHERSFDDDMADTGVIFPTVGSALSPSVTNWLNGACEYVCQTFIREQKEEKTRSRGKISIKKKTGKAEYCLRVGPHSIFMTGFRLEDLTKVLPDCIVNPSYAKVKNLIEGE